MRPLLFAAGAVVLGATVSWSIAAMHQASGPGEPRHPQALAAGPVTPIPAVVEVHRHKAALGNRLFHDSRLSYDDSVSCATCHDLRRAGQDGLPVSIGIDGRQGALNSPTVFNSGFNTLLFWDGRAATLEQQVSGPIHNPVEMGSSWSEVVAKLGDDAGLVAEFRSIWPDGLTVANVEIALAEFQRSLITPDAPFDRFLLGDVDAISHDALQGWILFRDLGCVSCHQGVNLGGNMYATLGVMGDYFADRGRPVTEADLGRYNLTGRERDRHVFRVPGLRNVALTAPYFHDGSIPTLEDAVRTMTRYQLGIVLDEERTPQVVAFLYTLTGVPPDSSW